MALTAQADSQAWGSATAGGEIEGRSGTNDTDADVIEIIQANCIDDQSLDALTIACISEMNRMRDNGRVDGIYTGPVSELGRQCLANTTGFFTMIGIGLLKDMGMNIQELPYVLTALRSIGQGNAPALGPRPVVPLGMTPR